MTEDDKLRVPNFDSDLPADDAVIARALKWSLMTLVATLAVGGGIVWWLDRPAPRAFPPISAAST